MPPEEDRDKKLLRVMICAAKVQQLAAQAMRLGTGREGQSEELKELQLHEAIEALNFATHEACPIKGNDHMFRRRPIVLSRGFLADPT